MAWHYEVLPSATAGEATELRRANGQSFRNARNKLKSAKKSEKIAREPFVVRVYLAGIGQGGLFIVHGQDTWIWG